jgi:hypothetical protein
MVSNNTAMHEVETETLFSYCTTHAKDKAMERDVYTAPEDQIANFIGFPCFY